MTTQEFSFNFKTQNDDDDQFGEEEEIPLNRKLTRQEMKQLAQQACEQLPEDVQPKVNQLLTQHEQYLALRDQYTQELLQLHQKYEKEFSPMFEQRAQLIKEGNVANFWKNVLLHSELADDMIQERDWDSLTYLTNIRSETFTRPAATPEEKPTQGFTLFFEYDNEKNPYFTNSVLTKTFFYDMDDEMTIAGKSEGCTINWKSEESNLTIEMTEKKQRHKSGKGVRKVKRAMPCDSFYNFFNAIEDEDEEENDEENVTADLIEADIEIGALFKEDIIPNALDYYLGVVPVEETPDEVEMLRRMGLGGDSDEEAEEDDTSAGANLIKRSAGDNQQQQECKQQ